MTTPAKIRRTPAQIAADELADSVGLARTERKVAPMTTASARWRRSASENHPRTVVSAADAELWARLADEIDAHLNASDQDPPLFEEPA